MQPAGEVASPLPVLPSPPSQLPPPQQPGVALPSPSRQRSALRQGVDAALAFAKDVNQVSCMTRQCWHQD